MLPKRSELMERAAEILDECGWTKNMLGSREEGLCLLGAAYEAMRDFGFPVEHKVAPVTFDFDSVEGVWFAEPNADDHPAIFASECIHVVVPNGVSVPAWNDHILVNKEQAIDTLMKAAKHWRDQGE